MNKVELTIKAIDTDYSIAYKDNELKIPRVTELHKQEVIVGDYRHIDFYLNTMYSFLESEGFSRETILSCMEEFIKDRKETMR